MSLVMQHCCVYSSQSKVQFTVGHAVSATQVYKPMEWLLGVAAVCTVIEAVLPPLVAVQKETIRQVVRAILSLTYVIASSIVVFSVKRRVVKEKLWQAELAGVPLCKALRLMHIVQWVHCASERNDAAL